MSSQSPQPGSGRPTVAGYVPPQGTSRPLPPRRIILEQPMGGLRKVVLSLAIAALVISLMFNVGLLGAYHSYVQTDTGIEEKLHSGSATATDKIAIITLKGVIMEGDGFVKKQIDRITKDIEKGQDIKAVVVRVDSPGGTVTGSDYIYYHLKKLRTDKKIPIVVSMGSLAASGGYYISMCADGQDTIYAEPATWTGSIGVIIPHYDISKFLAEHDIKDDSIASGPLKQMLSPTRIVDETQRKQEQTVVKELVDESFNRFKEIVAEGRPKLKEDPALMAKATTGQIFSASQAQKLGLIDKIGYLDDAVERAGKLAGINAKQARVVKYHQPVGLREVFMGGSSESATQLGMLLDMTAPRAFYLCTWLPGALATAR
ncbi:MAG: signal peptide peptidase SppA [Planctomycetes bacterium]|nr:signal peptide peptidase SppA [Planctomycetota bacterium]